MEEALLNLVNGVPIAAAVLYVWIISEKNHTFEIGKWRETIEKKDSSLAEMQKSVSDLTVQIQKLLFIMENYVTTNRKNSVRKQD
jgi:cell division protein FtsL